MRKAPKVAANGVLPSACRPVCRADHRLLGDVHLHEPFGRDGLEILGVGGVPYLAVEHHEVGAVPGEPCERLAEGLAGRDRLRIGGRGLRPELAELERLDLRGRERGHGE